MSSVTRVNFKGSTRAVASSFALAIALATLLCALWSSARLPLTWDEGDAFNRGSQLIAWLDAVARSPARASESPFRASSSRRELDARRYFSAFPDRSSLFGSEPLSAAFPHTIYREGHPPGASWTLAFGRGLWLALGGSGSTATGYRFGFILLFATSVGAVGYRVARSFGGVAALLAACFIVTTPRLFAHGQLAGGDSLLISSWALAWSLFDGARRNWYCATLWGAALALSLTAKFSGFILPLPFALVACVELIRRRARSEAFVCARLAYGCVIAVALFFALSPPLWRAPISGFITFFNLNTERADYNIPIFFFGEFYSPQRPLPWWNGFFWPLATLPGGLLAFVALAFFRAGRRARAFAPEFARAFWSAVALAVALPITRAFPGLPVHDGARLLIASTLFWAILGAVGARTLLVISAKKSATPRRAARALVAFVALANIWSLLSSAPQFLSYYNVFVGGVVGGTRLGLEPTYYWDAFDREVTTALRAKIKESQSRGEPSGVLFSAFSSQTLDYYADWNVLGEKTLETISEPTRFESLDRFGYYVVQSRPSGMSPFDLAVIQQANPIITKRVKNAAISTALTADPPSVVLLRVYDMRDVMKIISSSSADKR